MDSPLNLLVLQDKKETRHALSTAPLLEKSVPQCRLLSGEIFDPDTCLADGWQNSTMLLYPSDNAINASSLTPSEWPETIIIPDGTWKKTARILHLNPWLSKLPAISIDPDAPSRYRIRKSPRQDGLSTLEAAVTLMNTLEKTDRFNPLLKSFEQMIEYQIEAMGEEVYQRNYLK